MSSILEVLPQKQLVSLGGRAWVVGELTINDLAKIQMFLEQTFPHPLEAVRNEISNLEGRPRQRALAKLQDQAFNYQPTYPSFIADRLFKNTLTGGAFFLLMILGKSNQIDANDALTLHPKITDNEWDHLDRVLWGVSPTVEFQYLLTPAQPASGKKPDWCKMIGEVQQNTCLTFEQIGNLTISQFNVARTGQGREEYKGVDLTGWTQQQILDYLREQQELRKDKDGD